MSSINNKSENFADVNILHEGSVTAGNQQIADQSFYWRPDKINNNIIQLSHESTPLQVSNVELNCVSSNLHIIDLQVPECYDKIEISHEQSANNILNLNFKTQTSEQDSLPSSLNHQIYPAIEYLTKTSADDVGKDLICTPMCPSLEQEQFLLSPLPPESELHLSVPSMSKTLPTCENQFSLQIELLPFPSTSSEKDSPSDKNLLDLEELQNLDYRKPNYKEEDENKTKKGVDNQISQNLTIFKDEIPQKREKLKCQCSYCSADKSNKIKNTVGELLHVRHRPDCGRAVCSSIDLKRHLNSHNNKKNFFCAYCSQGFPCNYDMEMHMKIWCPNRNAEGDKTMGLDGKPQHVCNYFGCRKIYSKTRHLKKHIALRHNNEKNFVCAHCNEGFADKYTMKKHVEEHIYLLQNRLKNGKVDRQVLQNFIIPQSRNPQKSKRTKCQCPNCSAEFGNQTRDSVGRLVHICYFTDCKRVYYSVPSLNRHLQRNHDHTHHFERHIIGKQDKCQRPNYNSDGGNQTKGSDDLSLHICRHCKRIFAKAADLKAHLKWYSSKENFFCAHCPKGYSRKRSLALHVKIHTPVKQPFTCTVPDCKKMYTSSRHFKEHLVWHSGVKENFFCTYCDRRFTRKSHLGNHLRVHMPEYKKQ